MIRSSLMRCGARADSLELAKVDFVRSQKKILQSILYSFFWLIWRMTAKIVGRRNRIGRAASSNSTSRIAYLTYLYPPLKQGRRFIERMRNLMARFVRSNLRKTHRLVQECILSAQRKPSTTFLSIPRKGEYSLISSVLALFPLPIRRWFDLLFMLQGLLLVSLTEAPDLFVSWVPRK